MPSRAGTGQKNLSRDGTGMEFLSRERNGNRAYCSFPSRDWKVWKPIPGIPSRNYVMKIKAAQTAYLLAKMAIFPPNWLFIAEIGYFYHQIWTSSAVLKIEWSNLWSFKIFFWVKSAKLSVKSRTGMTQREWPIPVPGREWTSVPGIFRDWQNLAKSSHSREWKPVPVPSRDRTGYRSSPKFFMFFRIFPSTIWIWTN